MRQVVNTSILRRLLSCTQSPKIQLLTTTYQTAPSNEQPHPLNMNPKSTQKPGAVGKSSEEPAALGGNEKQAEANFKDDSMDHQVFQKLVKQQRLFGVGT